MGIWRGAGRSVGGRLGGPRVWGAALAVGVAAPAVAVVVASGAGGGPEALAAGSQIACTGFAGSTEFRPGIKITSGSTEATNSASLASVLTGCLSGGQPTITQGTVTWSKVPGTTSCDPTKGSGGFTADSRHPVTITWKNVSGGTVGTSTITGTGGYTITASGTVTATASGTVTAGLFNGGTAVPVFLSLIADLANCALPGGATTATATGSFAIT
ncbi:hypothetical protein [Actinomadura alba]|uniref:Ig-like domain-containing protein n=1 Tax=Actinomadura alba TaxID=406431 RepID=A0ABR7LKQ3_9ACTN|nr:hypothetical protein [Actinomadura alba]MBC6465070.1 hypothetical protein [Actinomadura alba]